jgi:hypothetical protein
MKRKEYHKKKTRTPSLMNMNQPLMMKPIHLLPRQDQKQITTPIQEKFQTQPQLQPQPHTQLNSQSNTLNSTSFLNSKDGSATFIKEPDSNSFKSLFSAVSSFLSGALSKTIFYPEKKRKILPKCAKMAKISLT